MIWEANFEFRSLDSLEFYSRIWRVCLLLFLPHPQHDPTLHLIANLQYLCLASPGEDEPGREMLDGREMSSCGESWDDSLRAEVMWALVNLWLASWTFLLLRRGTAEVLGPSYGVRTVLGLDPNPDFVVRYLDKLWPITWMHFPHV